MEINFETYIILPFSMGKNQVFAELGQQIENYTLLTSPTSPDSVTLQALGQPTGLDVERIEKNIFYQTHNYFHLSVQHFWFRPELTKHYRHQLLNQVEITILDTDLIHSTKVSKVTLSASCDLHLFQTQIGVLALHLRSTSPLPLKITQFLSNQFRRVFPPYIGERHGMCTFGGHFAFEAQLQQTRPGMDCVPLATHRPDPAYLEQAIEATFLKATQPDSKHHQAIIAEHWKYLLAPFLSDMELLGDDRSGICNLLQVNSMKGALDVERGDLIRLCFADPQGYDPLPYSQSFLQNFENEFCYDRFWYQAQVPNSPPQDSTNSPSRIMNCGYAFTWIGDASDGYFFNNQSSGAPMIFRHIYTPMAIMAYMQQATLQHISAQLSREFVPPKRSETDDYKKFHSINETFIGFTQNFWFHEVSPQEQGIAIFDTWRNKLRTPVLYDTVREEISDLGREINITQQEIFNQMAFFFAFVQLPLTIFTFNKDYFDFVEKKDILDCFDSYHLLVAIDTFLVIFLLIAFFYRNKKLAWPVFRKFRHGHKR